MAFSSSPSFLTLTANSKPNLNPKQSPFLHFRPKHKRLFSNSIKYTSNFATSFPISSCSYCKLQRIVTEFESLPEPIDRVKRLLHYATLLPSGEVRRVSSNKVTGCTVDVWLDVSMDELGRMRFLADSDSEIMKGFLSCLISLLDGEFPEVVLKLKMEDLEVMNIGLYGRANSRVNAWNNVLVNMKKRTQVLAEDDSSSSSSSLCLWRA